MKLISQMKQVDEQAIQSGISSLNLMEEAGRQVAQWIDQRYPPTTSVLILVGTGNNGGDGYVSARYLTQAGFSSITLLQNGDLSRQTPDTQTQHQRLLELANPAVHCLTVDSLDWDHLEADIIVDALFGIGLNRPLDESTQALLDKLNHYPAFKLAIDIASGIDAKTGQVFGAAFQANVTLTLSAPKAGLYLYPGKAYTGQVEVIDIGIPPHLIKENESQFELLTSQEVKQLLPNRPADVHKYELGKVLVIAGSQTMPGAAYLALQAALSVGPGLVTLAAPACVFTQLILPPEVIRLSLPSSESGHLSKDAWLQIVDSLPQYQVIAIGPGMGKTPENQAGLRASIQAIQSLKEDAPKAVILDADALNCLAELPNTQLDKRFVLTPHLGECARLMDVDTRVIKENLPQWVLKTAHQYNANVVLKSATTLIASPQGEHWLNTTGNPGMATAGSGDVLTGIIAGLAAQQATPLPAAISGVYLHGLAGDKAAKRYTNYGVNASRITKCIPSAFKRIISGDRAHDRDSY